MKGLAAIFAKLFDSFAKGFLGKALVGAGLTLASTATITTLINSYVSKLQSDVYSMPADLLMILGLSKVDYAISVVLSAVVSRVFMNSLGIFIKQK